MFRQCEPELENDRRVVVPRSELDGTARDLGSFRVTTGKSMSFDQENDDNLWEQVEQVLVGYRAYVGSHLPIHHQADMRELAKFSPKLG